MKTPKEKYYRVYVDCNGVKNRCRKPMSHSFRLGNAPIDSDMTTLEKMARAKLASEMKTILYPAKLKLLFIESYDSDGVTIEEWRPFSGADKSLELGFITQ